MVKPRAWPPVDAVMSPGHNNMRELKKYLSPTLSVALLFLAALSIFFFPNTPSELFKVWASPEYSHAPLVLPVIGYLLYRNRSSFYKVRSSNNWGGVPLIILGIFGLFLANYANFWVFHGYGYLLVLLGAFYTVFGPKWMRANWQIFLLIFLVLPFPTILYKGFSLALQSMATKLGVNIISLFGGSVFRNGNIIDLGDAKLQVVDACSGLRYIIPLISLSVIYSFFHKGGLASKIILILLSIPIAVIVNGVRVGLMGLGVEYFDMEVSEGAGHDFEGGVMFLLALSLLILFGMAINRLAPFLGQGGKSEAEKTNVPSDYGRNGLFIRYHGERLGGIVTALFCLVIAGYYVRYGDFSKDRLVYEYGGDANKNAVSLSEFPMDLGGWKGQKVAMDEVYLGVLYDEGLDDYILAEYRSPSLGQVNFYVAYYGSVGDRWNSHTPSGCMLASGWSVLNERNIKIGALGGATIRRVLAQQADGVKVLTYYTFKEGSEFIVPELGIMDLYKRKVSAIKDSFSPPSAQHALIRVYTMIDGTGQSAVAKADLVIQKFLNDASGSILEYVP